MYEVIRWNTWITVRPVQFEDEEEPQARTVRLACAENASRRSDSGWPTVIEGQIVAVAHSIVHVRRMR